MCTVAECALQPCIILRTFLNILVHCTVSVLCVYRLPRDIDSRATITIGTQKFEVEATDLESIEIMGRGAYGVVERMRHRPSDTVMAVKVISFVSFEIDLGVEKQNVNYGHVKRSTQDRSR